MINKVLGRLQKNAVLLVFNVGFLIEFIEVLSLFGIFMNRCFIKFMTIFFGLFFAFDLWSTETEVQKIQNFHEKPLTLFCDVALAPHDINHEKTELFLTCLHQTDHDYVKRLQQDIKQLKKIIKQNRKQRIAINREKCLIKSLEEIQKIVRKYQLQFSMIQYHAKIKSEWAEFFAVVDQGQDITGLLSKKGIMSQGKKGLKILAARINRIKDKIEEYEYRLHADWVNLKLKNYVLRIECIRLRNAAIFHPLYRGRQLETIYPR